MVFETTEKIPRNLIIGESELKGKLQNDPCKTDSDITFHKGTTEKQLDDTAQAVIETFIL